MRIISGDLKGRIINAPKDFDLRPTTDRAKEGLFNILNNEFDFSEISLLDLFSGIGSISLESASRGCTDIVSVEKNAKHASFIKKTANDLKIRGMKVLVSETRDFLKIANREFSVIFADPPYNLPWLQDLPNLIYASKAVGDETMVIIEHPESFDFSQHPHFARLCKYGKVHFSFFRSKK